MLAALEQGSNLLSHLYPPELIAAEAAGSERLLAELVLGGLTFEAFVLGLNGSAGGPIYRPLADLRFGTSVDARLALILRPGVHLAAVRSALPVVRGQWQLAARLCALLPHVRAVGWPASETLLPPDRFAAASAAWQAGGGLPCPGLLTLRPSLGGALQSAGLALFTGQELRLESDLAQDPAQGSRLGLRIAETLIHRGPLEQPEEFIAPSGASIRLEPSANGRFVRAWPA